MDRHRERHGGSHDSLHYRQQRAPSRFPDASFDYHRRSPNSYKGAFYGNGGRNYQNQRPFDIPHSHTGGGDGFGLGRRFQAMPHPGDFNFNNPVPSSGQKRAYPFSDRGRSPPETHEKSSFAKLFVGSIPRSLNEDDIRPLFEEHGRVIEVALIKDKRTGKQQGCCFIKYMTSEEADKAINALHNHYIFPEGVGPIQVRYADGERERLGETEYKLFVGSVGKLATEREVQEIFSPYGQVEDVYIMRDDMKRSRGCGFVKFAKRDMAVAAIDALNGIYTMRGCDQPLTVRFADPKRPRPGDIRSVQGLGPMAFNNGSDNNSNNNMWHVMSPPSSSGGGEHLIPRKRDAGGADIAPLRGMNKGMRFHGESSHEQAGMRGVAVVGPQKATTTSSGLQLPLQGVEQQQQQQLMMMMMMRGFQSPKQQPVPQQQLQHSLAPANVRNLQQPPLPAVASTGGVPVQQQMYHHPQSPHVMMMMPSAVQQQQHQQRLSQWGGGGGGASVAVTEAAAPPPPPLPPPPQQQTPAATKCSWSEHTSPDGYKYYYNSLTGESRWEKPLELTLYEKQQQQQQSIPPHQHQLPPSHYLQLDPLHNLPHDSAVTSVAPPFPYWNQGFDGGARK